MSIRLTVTLSNFAEALGHIKKVTDYIDGDAGKDVTVAAFNAAGTVFEKNFQSEGIGYGVGGWDDLADSTVRKREAAGFGGEHPILVRYNDLRTISATALRIADGSGAFSATDPEGKTIRLSLNIGNRNSWANISGDKAWNQIETSNHPARPFWFTTKTVQFAVRRRAVDALAEGLKRL